jgi:hypothetical protein
MGNLRLIRGTLEELLVLIDGRQLYCWIVRGLLASEQVLVLHDVAVGPAIASQPQIFSSAHAISRIRVSSSLAVQCVS